MNIYVVGLNQLFDVEIDKVCFNPNLSCVLLRFCILRKDDDYILRLQVNKPTLPLASGEFSMSTGVVLVAASCIMVFSLM